ncbi:GNAT family N-acetyltransferase [Salinicola tamaricis]|uniref:GNAT family N-acetyltransferase n=1 Tax=Salinicola tamaricis TaxID=1771309 RepID=UPI001A911B76|nr:GNAT family N-acetyltransferase [Salinicola tamaricis]
MLTKIRPIRREDLSSVLSWRNHPDVRQYMYTQQEIAWEEHLAWFESVCARDNSYVMIFENDGIPSGVLNINIVSKSDKRAEWGFYLSPMAAKGSGSLLGSQACEFV